VLALSPSLYALSTIAQQQREAQKKFNMASEFRKFLYFSCIALLHISSHCLLVHSILSSLSFSSLSLSLSSDVRVFHSSDVVYVAAQWKQMGWGCTVSPLLGAEFSLARKFHNLLAKTKLQLIIMQRKACKFTYRNVIPSTSSSSSFLHAGFNSNN